MNREQYLKRREDLLAQAQSCLDSGDMDGYNNAVNDIKNLDTSFEDHAKEQANLNAIAGNVHAVPDAFKNAGNSCGEYASVNEMYNSVEYRTALMYNFGFRNSDSGEIQKYFTANKNIRCCGGRSYNMGSEDHTEA